MRFELFRVTSVCFRTCFVSLRIALRIANAIRGRRGGALELAEVLICGQGFFSSRTPANFLFYSVFLPLPPPPPPLLYVFSLPSSGSEDPVYTKASCMP